MKKTGIILLFIPLLFGCSFAQKQKIETEFQTEKMVKDSWYGNRVPMLKAFHLQLQDGQLRFQTENYVDWEIETGSGKKVGEVVYFKDDEIGIGWDFKLRNAKWQVLISAYQDNTNDPRESWIITGKDSLKMMNGEPDACSFWSIADRNDARSWEYEPIATIGNNLDYYNAVSLKPQKKWDDTPDWKLNLMKGEFTDQQVIGFVFTAVNALNVRYMEDLDR